jgi:hypothetical protein
MDREKQIRALKKKLWREMRCVVDLPPGIPDDLCLRLIRDAYEQELATGEIRKFVREELGDVPGVVTHLDFCSGWCPECPILQWCETARRQFTEEDRLWMATYHDYPPGFRFSCEPPA